MKRYLFTGVCSFPSWLRPSAMAADLARQGAGPTRPYLLCQRRFFSWDRVLHRLSKVGGAWGNTDWTFTGSGRTANHTTSGGLFGGEVGVNWQINQFVLGAEADFGWANINGSNGVS